MIKNPTDLGYKRNLNHQAKKNETAKENKVETWEPSHPHSKEEKQKAWEKHQGDFSETHQRNIKEMSLLIIFETGEKSYRKPIEKLPKMQ